MGREKPNKPRKPQRETPRIVDMPNVSVRTKKNVVITHIMSSGDPTWRMVEALTKQKHGDFTVAERDLLDLPAQARTEALNDLAFYATAQVPPQAPLGAQEAAARTAANCRQALARLRPLVEGE
ncbi:hypothetical protein [Streptomyces sp. NBC_01455]|uniref:hypothetical protein n=1 Tax=Streptomyces sp. NBC_01455 TaxID=2903874 RepID=UPI002E2FB393|nr:hypothetical protein [Streptomyces sp. NBC_01455]